MSCLTAEEECRDLLCQRLLGDPATPGQTDSHLQCRAGCRTAPVAQQSQLGMLNGFPETGNWFWFSNPGTRIIKNLTLFLLTSYLLNSCFKVV